MIGYEQVSDRSPILGQVMARKELNIQSVSFLVNIALLLLCGIFGSESLDFSFAGYEDFRPRPVLYSDGKTLAEVLFDDFGEMIHCRLHGLEDAADAEALIRASGLKVKYPSFQDMLQLINNCSLLERPTANATHLTETNSVEHVSSSSWSTWSLFDGIMPGTKWCGVGHTAGSFEDLGTQTEVDACCRAHDHCPVKIRPFRTDYGLINFSLQTKSHCDCDKEFFSCLKSSTNSFADVVGNLFFNIIKMQCIKEHRPFVCVENRTEISGSQKCAKLGAVPESKKMHSTITQLKY